MGQLIKRISNRGDIHLQPPNDMQVTQAFSDTNLIISGATAASLGLGRFVLLPIQRKFAAKAGLPTQNGVPHAEAGDRCGVQFTSEEHAFLAWLLHQSTRWALLRQLLERHFLRQADQGSDYIDVAFSRSNLAGWRRRPHGC